MASQFEWLKYLTAALPITLLLGWIIRRVSIHPLELASGRLNLGKSTHYCFAIHNPEEVPADDGVTVELTMILASGAFLRSPSVNCGPPESGTKGELGKDERSFRFCAPRIAAHSTWIASADCNGSEGDVECRVKHRGHEFSIRGRDAARPSMRRPLFLLSAGTVVALLTYLLPIHFELAWPLPFRVMGFTPSLDIPVLLFLLAACVVAWTMCKQPPAIVLGSMRNLSLRGTPSNPKVGAAEPAAPPGLL